jgi:hypothetical protein
MTKRRVPHTNDEFGNTDTFTISKNNDAYRVVKQRRPPVLIAPLQHTTTECIHHNELYVLLFSNKSHSSSTYNTNEC